MDKLSKDDKSLWQSYASNLNKISKKIFSHKSQQKVILNEKKNICNETNKLFLDEKTLKNLKKKKIKIESFLDLHGMNSEIAEKNVIDFVINAFNKNMRNVAIITGKGLNNNGILKNKAPEWIHKAELSKFVIGFTHMPNFYGGEGVIYIKIKNKNKIIKK